MAPPVEASTEGVELTQAAEQTKAAPRLPQASPNIPQATPAQTPSTAPTNSPFSCNPFSCAQNGCSTRYWVNAEYLNWWFKNSPIDVPLATTGPLGPGGTPFGIIPNVPGAIGTPGTQVLLGNQNFGTSNHAGIRLTFGTWLDPDQSRGVEVSYFLVADRNNTQIVGNTGALLTVPFLDVGPIKGQNTLILAAPGNPAFANGSAILGVTNHLQGEELNGIFNLSRTDTARVDLLVGARLLQFREALTFGANSVGTAPLGIDNASDSFVGNNNFYGGQLGLRAEFVRGPYFFGITEKFALGGLQEQMSVSGSTVTNFNPISAGSVQAFPGGVFAQPTNIGDHSRGRFTFANEVIATAGYQMNDWARVFISYDFIFLNNVARPGQQLNRSINDSQFAATIPPPGGLVGPASPAFSFRDSSFWAQGFNVGLSFRY
ncbi:MAG TPA: BBP7 family outer membrane beta-barrel protein [Gemmataceae bacterium]|nr:BBP7 family outer membrane beta-barrel protein [Gemmataceae bacterium]